MKLHYDFSKLLATTLVASSCFLGNGLYANAALAASWNMGAGAPDISAMVTRLYTEGTVKGAPVIELDNRTFNMARGKVGEKVVVGKVHVKATDMPGEVTIVPSGAVEGIYTTDVQTLPAGNCEMDVTVFYEAKKVGKNEGKLYFMVGEEIYEQINLKGLAIDPATPPAVNLEPAAFKEFSTEVGTVVKDTIVATLVGLPSSVNVKVEQDEPAFSINTGLLYYTVPTHNLVVTFNPKTAGTYEATITLTNEFFEPVVVKVKGTATAKEDVQPEKEGDELVLSYDHPVKLLNEGFDSGLHNQPLSMKGWINNAAIGERAWWGYTFPEYDKENAGEAVAKMTPYDSKVEAGGETECQALLITPPLDFKNAASKIFTFRVMGKNMTEGMADQFMFCSLAVYDGMLYAMPVEGVVMPSSPDQNGEWMDYHVDLSNSELGDVFHLAFLFYGMRGTVSSASYFVDDVSWGRTDLPVITPEKPELVLDLADGNRVSEWVKVSGKNLTQDIKLSLGGKDMSSFELSTPSLSKEGGQFFVKFKGENEGTYEANVKLASRGAATKYIAFVASVATGVQTVVTETADRVKIYDQAGRCVKTVDGASVASALESLPGGTYVVRVTNEAGTRTMKVMK